jgi:hypothetical protein
MDGCESVAAVGVLPAADAFRGLDSTENHEIQNGEHAAHEINFLKRRLDGSVTEPQDEPARKRAAAEPTEPAHDADAASEEVVKKEEPSAEKVTPVSDASVADQNNVFAVPEVPVKAPSAPDSAVGTALYSASMEEGEIRDSAPPAAKPIEKEEAPVILVSSSAAYAAPDANGVKQRALPPPGT